MTAHSASYRAAGNAACVFAVQLTLFHRQEKLVASGTDRVLDPHIPVTGYVDRSRRFVRWGRFWPRRVAEDLVQPFGDKLLIARIERGRTNSERMPFAARVRPDARLAAQEQLSNLARKSSRSTSGPSRYSSERSCLQPCLP